MRVIDLTEDKKRTYFLCLENYSEEMRDAIQSRENWYNKMRDNGLRVKLAEDESGEIGGMVQYFPIEHSWVKGEDLYFVSCIWVKSYKPGGGTFQNQGMGKALMKAVEEDVKGLGKKGIVVWGTSLPVWMRASWYKKLGYEKVDKKGLMGDVLLWKTFDDSAQPPKWVKRKKTPGKGSDKVKVTCMTNGWCTASNLGCHRTLDAAKKFGDQVEVEVIDTMESNNFNEWGFTDGIFIDGKKVSFSPPPSIEKVHQLIEKRTRKLK